MFGNLGNMMKQLQQAQKRAAEMQEQLADERIEATSGGGLVTVTTDGLGTVLEVRIDGAKMGLEADDAEMLQDAVLAAVQEAVSQAQALGKDMLSDITGGLELPPGLGGLAGMGG